MAACNVNPAENLNSMCGIVIVARREKKLHRVAQTIDYSMDFCVQPAARTAYSLVARPFLPPLAL
jgi:hypothetical protein